MRRLVIAPLALREARDALQRSRNVFGSRAARAYEALIRRAYKLLCADPRRAGVQRREDLPRAPRVFHLRHARTRGAAPKQPRHFIVFTYDDTTLTVLRVLHDSMDIPRHVSEVEKPEE
jgi:toxin ParE1/3/4